MATATGAQQRTAQGPIEERMAAGNDPLTKKKRKFAENQPLRAAPPEEEIHGNGEKCVEGIGTVARELGPLNLGKIREERGGTLTCVKPIEKRGPTDL